MTEIPLADLKCSVTGAPLFFRSVAAYGKARGVSRQAASKWNTRDGVIVFRTCPVTDRDWVDAVASDERRNGDLNPLKAHADPGFADDEPVLDIQVEKGEPTESTEVGAPTEAPARAPSADPVRTRAAESKAIQEEIKAKTARLDFEERMGRLIPVDVAMDQNRRQASRTLEAILRLPMEAAEEANPDDPARARAAMQRHIRLILEQFAAAGMAEIEQARILLQSAEVDVHA